MRILVYTRTTEYRHESIPAGVAALSELGGEHGFAVEHTEEPGAFAADRLAGYAAVVFLSTSGDVFDTDAQRHAFEGFVTGGGGFVGIHCAAATEYGWPFYGDLVGAWFDRHPEVQPGRAVVEDREHPATAHLPAFWDRVDEWYDFHTNPRGRVRVLLSADEASYAGAGMGPDHPLAWCHENCGGRSFYTALGHTQQSYAEPEFRAHLLGGIRYAAG
ncbi:ThuA domain-containing protein [Rhizomonospora bruguierae]|uniref:ThuA domain-containing protein n=1 Tax=Rhizomonospora bruguierae TaxID=1581705 RepID=UPI001BD112ED|nr:ThuA domain-containing protein [Micromonospora sp. NBRC 107566]